jgi:hypothetical protein
MRGGRTCPALDLNGRLRGRRDSGIPLFSPSRRPHVLSRPRYLPFVCSARNVAPYALGFSGLLHITFGEGKWFEPRLAPLPRLEPGTCGVRNPLVGEMYRQHRWASKCATVAGITLSLGERHGVHPNARHPNR